jgi:hypothetical protein
MDDNSIGDTIKGAEARGTTNDISKGKAFEGIKPRS